MKAQNKFLRVSFFPLGNPKLNGASTVPVRNRPRIPTPDVTKEVMDREQQSRFTTTPALMPTNHHQTNQGITSGVTLMPQHLQSNYPGGYPTGDVPVVQVVLSPIQELDGSGSVNNTLHPGQPGTAALAQAVLSPGLGPVLTTPMTVSQLTAIGLTNSPLLTQAPRSPSFVRAFQPEKSPSPPKAIEPPESSDDVERLISSRNSNTSVGSDTSNASKETKESLASNHSNTTASVTSTKSLEDTPKVAAQTVNTELVNMAIGGEVRSRKTSATSQNNSGPSPKRGEVYV